MTETVTNEVGEGLYSSIENNPPEDNFLELFWKEQKKAFQSNPKGMRWHPMMIRFAIFLQYQSSRAYEAIKESGVLKLPNKSTLRDYTNVITPATGFQPHVFEVCFELVDLTLNQWFGLFSLDLFEIWFILILILQIKNYKNSIRSPIFEGIFCKQGTFDLFSNMKYSQHIYFTGTKKDRSRPSLREEICCSPSWRNENKVRPGVWQTEWPSHRIHKSRYLDIQRGKYHT